MLSKTYLLLLAFVCACIGMTMAMPDQRFRGDGVMMPAAGMRRVKRGPVHVPTAGGEDQEDKEDKEPASADGKAKIVASAEDKKQLRNMVESLVRLVNGLRHDGAIRLPDPLERVFKGVIEAMDTLQDDLDADLDIDLGNLLNSGGK
ncbi:hypothetical protein BCR42DRAFT_421734 [Absidia repens]|uniref:Uncharacterized protein n=1 Tax=Absidia repens TaxID=90262 RepID=A0A1X2I7S0_9FUNG|nr:hypothetical protein BCR42DRAFT_421734 [Absidia repens]